MPIRGIRGATTVEANTREAILEAAGELLGEIIRANDIKTEDVASAYFSTTTDLNAEFPAVAARNLGLNQVPLLCGQEIDVPNSMRGIVRVLVHYYAARDHTPAHTYLGEAQELRSDLDAAQ